MIYIILMLFLLLFSKLDLKTISLPVFSIVSLIVISGIRYYVGVDYSTYAQIYDWLSKGLAEFQVEKSPLFAQLMFLGMKTGLGYQMVIFVCSLVFFISYFLLMRMYLNNVELSFSFFLLFASEYIFFSFNIFRQISSLAVVLLGFILLFRKKNFFYVIACQLIAFEIHSISLLFIIIYPMMFLIKKMKSKKILFLIYIISCLFIFFNPVSILEVLPHNILGRYATYFGTDHLNRSISSISKLIVPNFIYIYYLKNYPYDDFMSVKKNSVLSGFSLYIFFMNFGVGIELIIRIAVLFIPFYILGIIDAIKNGSKSMSKLIYYGIIIYGFILVLWIVYSNGYGIGVYQTFFDKPLLK